MVVAVISWELSLPECRSLKEKRSVVKSLKDRLQNRFKVSVAETGHQDLLTRAQVSAAIVTSDRRLADSVLDKMDRFVDADGRALILDTHRFLH